MKLLIFAVCEKLLVDEDKNISLIVLIQNITAAHKKNEKIPASAISPQPWTIFTLWEPDRNFAGKPLVQNVKILLPDKSEFREIAVPFTMEDRSHTNKINIIGFPVGLDGPLEIEMWVEHELKRITDTYTYTINVKHQETKTP